LDGYADEDGYQAFITPAVVYSVRPG